MKTAKCIRLCVTCVLLSLSAMANAGSAFYWKGSDWGSFADPANWTVGAADFPYADTDGNPSVRIPGAGDWIFPVTDITYNLDLGGGDYVIEGIHEANHSISKSFQKFQFSNGVLRVRCDVDLTERRLGWTVCRDATYEVAATGDEVSWGWGGGAPTIRVSDGGRYLFSANWLRNQCSTLTVDPGGFARISLKDGRAAIHRGVDAQTYSLWQNSGTMELPQGIGFWSTQSGTEREWGETSWRIVQREGTMLIGGNITRNGMTTYPINFTALGGTLVFSNSVSFADSGHACLSNSVVVDCVRDATGDLSGFAFGDGAAIAKRGPGLLNLRETPSQVSVESGAVRLTGAFGGRKFSFASGVRVVFAAKVPSTVSAADWTGWPLADYEIDESVFAVGDTVLVSADEGLLDAVAAKINARLSASLPYAAEAVDGRIRLRARFDAIFDAAKVGDLSDASGWGGGPPPPSATVALSGAGTVAYTANSPSFAKVIVRDGATLEVTGGTEESPVVLPPILLEDNGRLRVAEDAWVSIENDFASTGLRDSLPVFEVATGAVAQVCWMEASAKQRAVARFKNVAIRHYGTIRMPVMRTKYGQVTIGYAEPGEIALIAYSCEGGRFHRARDSWDMADWGGVAGRVNFLCPAVGGRVQAVGEIVLHDYLGEPRINICNYGYDIGVNNPPDEPFTLVCSGATLIEPNGPTVFGGAANLVFRDESALTRPWRMHHPNCPTHVRFTDLATATFGPGTKYHLFYSHYSYWLPEEQVGTKLLSATGGHVALTFQNAVASMVRCGGVSNAVVRMIDSSFEVGYRHPTGNGSTPPPNTVDISMFEGAKAIDVPEGSLLTVCATNEESYSSFLTKDYQWNRRVYLDCPLTGGGDVSVSNHLPAIDGMLADWDMCLAIRCGANTLTGEIRAQENVPAHVVFQDGANWAGTVVANGRVSLSRDATVTNEAEIAALGPASVAFGSIRFENRTFPIRVWSVDGVKSSDAVDFASPVSGRGALEIAPQLGYEPEEGDRFLIGTYPAGATLPRIVPNGWRLEPLPVAGDSARVRLGLVRRHKGFCVTVR